MAAAKAAAGGGSPYEASSWWRQFSFGWMTPLYDRKGKDMAEDTDPVRVFEHWPCPAEDDPAMHAELMRAAWDSRPEGASLLRVMWTVYGGRWARTGGLKAVGFLSVALTPLLIKQFLIQLSFHTAGSAQPDGAEERWPFWGLLALVPTMTLVSLLYTVCWHHYMQKCIRIGMCVRSGVVMMVYRKALRLTAQQLASSSNSEVNNLVTSDAERVAQGLTFSHFAWGSPVEILIGTFLAFAEIGWPAFVALGILLMQVPIQGRFGKVTGQIRTRVAGETDERVHTMNEILNGHQTIKLYSWEETFQAKIKQIRQREIKQLWRMQMLMGTNRALSFVTTMLVTVASFGLYEMMGSRITIAKAFACLAYYRQIELAITMLPLAIDAHVQMTVATRRVQGFLSIPEAGNAAKLREGAGAGRRLGWRRRSLLLASRGPLRRSRGGLLLHLRMRRLRCYRRCRQKWELMGACTAWTSSSRRGSSTESSAVSALASRHSSCPC